MRLYLIIILVCLVRRNCKAIIIPEQNPFDQRSDIVKIGDSGTLETTFNIVGNNGIDTGSAFGFLPIPFVSIALLMMAIAMLIMPSSVTSRATPVAPRPDVQTTVPATVQSIIATQAEPAQTTPCIPTNCPADYKLLTDQTASPNCYFFGGNTGLISWPDALKACTSTPGANLWRPNTRAEADAVKTTFAIDEDEHIYTGAHSPFHDDNYVFAVDNAAFSFIDPPFGVENSDRGSKGEDCVDIMFDSDWEWENDDCEDKHRYVCELPRKACS